MCIISKAKSDRSLRILVTLCPLFRSIDNGEQEGYNVPGDPVKHSFVLMDLFQTLCTTAILLVLIKNVASKQFTLLTLNDFRKQGFICDLSHKFSQEDYVRLLEERHNYFIEQRLSFDPARAKFPRLLDYMYFIYSIICYLIISL